LHDLKDKSIRIFIAGHKGMVGNSIFHLMKKEYDNIVVIDKTELNLLDQISVDKFIKDNKFDLVIMCAAKVGGILANASLPFKFLYDNLEIQNNIISSCYKHNVKNFIFLGSSCIYPNNFKKPIKETDLLSSKLEKTNEAYALAKIAGLKLCEYISLDHNYNYKSIMPCNLYGYNDLFNEKNSHVIPSLLLKFHNAKKNNLREVKIWGTGKPMREFLFVDDLSDAILFLIKNWINFKKLNMPFINVGYGSDISIKELSLLLKKITNYKGNLSFDESKPDGTYKKLLNSEIINKLGWLPKTTLNEGLFSTYKWFQESNLNLRNE
jgi:GDP-L-fucose synthase